VLEVLEVLEVLAEDCKKKLNIMAPFFPFIHEMNLTANLRYELAANPRYY
jgi:hypothetical protein